jgi:pepF/M3 family oligoendopeptidase
LDNIYESLESADYCAAFARLESLVDELETFFNDRQVRRLTAPPTDPVAEVLDEALRRVNEIGVLAGKLESFVYAYFTTNSYDAAAARETSKLEIVSARRQKLGVRLQAWIGSLAERLPSLIAERPALAEHQFFLTDSARRSKYLMAEELESLAADLCLDAGAAFGKLQGSVTSQLKVPFERDGKVETLPITVVHNFLYAADSALRERAYRAEIAGWESIRTTVAACLNGVKGTAQTLARRRGREHVLDEALDDNRIDRATLDAMLDAIREAFPVFRRYLRAKAKRLGQPQLRWWDLFAPLGDASKTFRWNEAREFIVSTFARFDRDLSDFAAQAFDGRWIDAEPRDGKRGGAYCMEVWGVEESRILANFDGSFEQVSTLAHELGHGYHNHCQRGLPPLRRGAPMTLAETASIFCETLIAESTLAEVSRDEQLPILESQLCGATQVCLDISSRFLFESAVFQRRASSEISPDELCQLMLAAQKATYADAVEESTYNPYMWLWKPHYYSHTHNFYNFPYAFGHLFALGLYGIFRREGASFVPRYQQLLRSTALDQAAPLAARFGIDITQPAFWQGSLKIIAGQVERYEAV